MYDQAEPLATAANADLDQLFDPNAIALVGASSDPKKLSGRPFRSLRDYGYDGDVFLVNPSTDEIDGTPTYDSVADVPGDVDVAMILLPADLVPRVVVECGEQDVPFAIVIASGFAETGESGREREAELLEVAREGGVRLVGPNSEGLLNLPDDVPLSFSSILKRDDLEPGTVAFVTQSGAFGGALFQLSQNEGIGTSKWVSTGNESDLTTLDYLKYLVDDPDTDTIVTYIESLTDGRRLREVGRRAAETDTAIVAMRAGASTEGEEAAASHTGSVATDDEIYNAVFRQTGVTRVRSVDECVDAISAYATIEPAAFPCGGDRGSDDGIGDDRGVAVVSMSGGAAVLLADTAHRLNLPLATLTEETRQTVSAKIPPYGSETNPVDVTAAAISDPDVFNTCIGTVLDDPNVTGLVVQFGNSGGDIIEEFKADLLGLAAGHETETAMATVFTGNLPAAVTRAELVDGGILVFEDPVRSVQTLKHLADRAQFLNRGTTALAAPDADFDAREPLPDADWETTVDALAAEGVAFLPSATIDSADAAVDAAAELGYPVALKLDPLAAAHKTELDGIRLDLDSPAAVRTAYDALPSVDGAGAIVQPMVEGVEVLVGVTDDPDFGPVMVVGPGGEFVELFDEFAYRSLPVSAAEAAEMLAETDVDRLLDGFRGRPPGDRQALVALIVAVSDAYCRYDVADLECNPVIVTEDDAVAIDLLLE